MPIAASVAPNARFAPSSGELEEQSNANATIASAAVIATTGVAFRVPPRLVGEGSTLSMSRLHGLGLSLCVVFSTRVRRVNIGVGTAHSNSRPFGFESLRFRRVSRREIGGPRPSLSSKSECPKELRQTTGRNPYQRHLPYDVMPIVPGMREISRLAPLVLLVFPLYFARSRERGPQFYCSSMSCGAPAVGVSSPAPQGRQHSLLAR